jgi:tetratricopeptide (TPR) repeat protein
LESCAGVQMPRGSCLGLLGRYAPAHELLAEAEATARKQNLLELQGEIQIRQAFLFFLEKDYVSSHAVFRAVLNIAGRVGGWYFRGNAFWGIGKNLMIQQCYHEALPWLEESLAIFENAGARLSIALVWSELAVVTRAWGTTRTH